MKTGLCSCLLSLLTPSAGLSVPAVSSVSSGDFQHGHQVTVAGTGFGTKEPAAPLIWEDFEDGNLDPELSLDGVSRLSNPADQRTGSTYNAGGSFSDYWYCSAQTAVTSTKWFCSLWYRLAPDWEWGRGAAGIAPLGNVKFFRVWATGGKPNYVMAWHTYSNQNTCVELVEYTSDSGSWGYMRPIDDLGLGAWHNNEFEYCENTGPDAADGQIRFWFNGQLKLNRTNVLTSSSEYPTRQKYILILGFMNSWDLSDKWVWLDNVYIDNTWARVEIGNKPTWTGCTQREMQTPTAWSNTSITVKVNQGPFQDGSAAYLYVVDANGSVNGQGFPVTFGQGEVPVADLTPPFVSGQSPAPDAQNVLVNSSVVLHVQDSGDGVDKGSIAMTVNDVAVTPQITGTPSDYTVTYVPASPFAYNATVTVTVNARDLHNSPNVMQQVSYTFSTQPAGPPGKPIYVD